MAAYRCSICNVNYPVDRSHQKCAHCGEVTAYFSNVNAHEDWEQRVAFLAQPPADRDWKVDWHRFNRLQALEVPVDLAMAVADARDYTNGGYAVDLAAFERELRKLVARGATVEQAARILAP